MTLCSVVDILAHRVHSCTISKMQRMCLSYSGCITSSQCCRKEHRGSLQFKGYLHYTQKHQKKYALVFLYLEIIYFLIVVSNKISDQLTHIIKMG